MDYVDFIDEEGIYHLKERDDKFDERGNPLFDPNFYRDMYGEVLERHDFVTDEDMLTHYIEYGKDENRFSTQESFDEFTEKKRNLAY